MTDAGETPTATGDHPLTLAVDVGGTKLKTCVVDRQGRSVVEPVIVSTPKPAPPEAILQAIADVAKSMPAFDRISVGFPGVVRGTVVFTAPNLGNELWQGFDLGRALTDWFHTPARVLNDAAVQGLAVVEGPGLEAVMTLGTGVGCAVYRDRHWLLHLELGLDIHIGNAALAQCGPGTWNTRVLQALEDVRHLTSCERVYLGGGNARKVVVPLPDYAKLVSNHAGLTGGVRLWEPEFDSLFADRNLSRPMQGGTR